MAMLTGAAMAFVHNGRSLPADDEIRVETRKFRMRPLDAQLCGIAAGDQRPRRAEPNNDLGHVVAGPASRYVRKSEATACHTSARCHGSTRV
jgi:hypothetical protein